MKSDLLTNTFTYIVCLHGAESTLLQILDRSGAPLGLEQKDRSSSTTIISPCSNRHRSQLQTFMTCKSLTTSVVND
ncbi:MAG: hypothetical protein K2Y01_07145 [Rhabdochlamydiaceae bacterium]|nr:hypothetical protein [Rhabdochlamydiaceae bacterium]